MNSFGLDLEIGLEASAQSHALAASGRGKGRKRQSHDARAVELAVNAKGVAREREDGVGAGQESGEGGVGAPRVSGVLLLGSLLNHSCVNNLAPSWHLPQPPPRPASVISKSQQRRDKRSGRRATQVTPGPGSKEGAEGSGGSGFAGAHPHAHICFMATRDIAAGQECTVLAFSTLHPEP
jgi:hypothetical protein